MTGRRLRSVPPPSLRRLLSGMPTDYVQCRDFGHRWEPWTARRVAEGYESVLRCQRCDTRKARAVAVARSRQQ